MTEADIALCTCVMRHNTAGLLKQILQEHTYSIFQTVDIHALAVICASIKFHVESSQFLWLFLCCKVAFTTFYDSAVRQYAVVTE